MRNQLDFNKMFHDYFGRASAKVSYKVRHDSNCFHDFVFLSGLVHDARFRRKDVVLRGKRLIVPLVRDCWERGVTDNSGTRQMYAAQSRLTIEPVTRIQWSFIDNMPFGLEDTLQVYGIWLARQAITLGDYTPLILSGFTWECTVNVYETDMVIQLQDLEMPKPHS